VLVAPPTFATRIGGMGYDSAYGIDGTVDEVMVFSRALSAAEIQALYAYYVALGAT